jgi:hypothetical protein
MRIPTAAVRRDHTASTAARSAKPGKHYRTGHCKCGHPGSKKPHNLNLAARRLKEFLERMTNSGVLRPLNLFPPAVPPAKNVPGLRINQGLAVAGTSDVRPDVDWRLPRLDPMLHGLDANHLSCPAAVTPRTEPMCVRHLQILLIACACSSQRRSALRATK